MLRIVAVLALLATLAACGEAPMGASEEAGAPADAPADAPKGPSYAGDIDAIGTEPFWAVKIRAASLTLSRPDHADLSNPNPGVRIDGEQGVWDSSGAEEDKGRLVVRLTPGACSDGMSDRVYRFFSEIWVDGETLKGCADHTAQLQAQPKP